MISQSRFPNQRDIRSVQNLAPRTLETGEHDETGRSYRGEHFHGGVLFLSRFLRNGSEFSFQSSGRPRDFIGFMASDSYHSAYSFGNPRFFGDDKVLDESGLRDMSVRPKSTVSGRIDNNPKATDVPPQNSMLVLLHFGFCTSLMISSTSNSSATTLTGSG